MSSVGPADGDLEKSLRSPLVSVVIPCFNQAHFLSEAIDSVLAQSYRRFEIVVVDDGSTDNTREVTASYKGVRYVRQNNAGLAAARNAGVDSSNGMFIVFLDADDVLLPSALEEGLKCFETCPECGFIYGGYRLVDVKRSFIRQKIPLSCNDHYTTLLRGNNIEMHATVMYKRDILKEVGGFDPSLAACEDYDVYLRIARHYPVHCHKGVVAEYRRHSSNMSSDAARMLVTSLAVLRSQRAHLGGKSDYINAYKDGLKQWQDYYGTRLLVQVVTGLLPRSGRLTADGRPRARRSRALRDSVILLRYAPRALPVALREAVRRIIGKVKASLPPHARRALRAVLRRSPPPGRVRFGDLRRVDPIDGDFGYGRGRPVDRYYIENFLARHAGDIHGRVLEIGDNTYTRRFGADRVTQSDVLHVVEGRPLATFIGDLTKADHIPSEAFNCIILTQTLHLIYDVKAALITLQRILKPGGVLLATFPGVSQIDRGEWRDSWCWSFTAMSARRLFGEVFPEPGLTVETYGNVLAAVAYLHGLAAEEVKPQELDYHDPSYQVIVAVRAVKAQRP